MLLTARPLTAQFSQLTMTDDGRQIYFTSPLLLKSSPGQGGISERRLYRLAPDGVSVAAERGVLAPASVLIEETGLEYPQVSGDGSLVAFTYVNVCPGAPQTSSGKCQPVDREGIVRGKQNLDLGRGSVQLSRNGRWALLTTPCCERQTSTLIDLSTAERTSVPNPASEARFSSIASDGTILVEQRDKDNYPTYGLWKQGTLTPITTTQVAPVAISDDAHVALLSWPQIQPGGVFTESMGVKDLDTGRKTMFFEQRDHTEWAAFMGMSSKGSRILYRRMPEYARDGSAYIYDVAAGTSQPIALAAGELVSDGTLSAAGDFAVVATTNGRLVKVNFADNAIATLIPATPYVQNLHGLVPGSLFHLRGALSGLVESWSGKVALDGHAVPVINALRGDVAIQVPWTHATGVFPFRLDLPGDTPFIQNQAVSVLAAAPQLEHTGPGETAILDRKIIKGDWSGFVDKPPGPGDIVHLYMTGLGPVNGAPPTGAPAPAGTLFPITGKIACGFNGSGKLDVWENWAAETLFAGLAPGMTGIYQVSLRLPPDEPSEIGWITCQVRLANGYRSTVID